MEKDFLLKELNYFLQNYEKATNSHNFEEIRPLIDSNASYYFSEGSYYSIEEIEKAIVNTWNKIQNETYSINNINWIVLEETTAVCTYTFHWKGEINGEAREGKGKGTNILVKKDSWKMIHEHLSSIN